MMKGLRFILSVLISCFALAVSAQGGKTPAEATVLGLGDNTCSFQPGESYDTPRYYSFTATERGLLKVEGTGTETTFWSVDAEGREMSCFKTSGMCLIPVTEGACVYVAVAPNMTLEQAATVYFYAGFEANDNAGRGTSTDDPIRIRLGKTDVTIDNVEGFEEFTNYFTFAATETGALTFSLSGYVLSGRYGTDFQHLDGTFTAEYKDGAYVGSIPVTAGLTVCIAISAYSTMTVSTKMSYPEKGTSYSYSIDLVEGANSVSAEYGEFWYKYNGADEEGYVTLTSEYEIPRGHVSVFGMHDLYTALAQSETGYYDLRFKVAPRTPYLVYVYKTEESEDWPNPDVVNVSFSPLQQGESASKPLSLEAGKSTALHAMNGTFYYALTLPEGTDKMIEVQVDGEAADACTLSLFDMQEGSYYAVSGTRYVKKEAQGGHAYMLQVSKTRGGEALLTATMRDIVPGESIRLPLQARLGDNAVAKADDVYYAYTATLTGRIAVQFSIPGVGIEFPVSTDASDGVRMSVLDGGKTKLDVEKGKTYYMHFSHVSQDCTFSFDEREYVAGETKELAIDVVGEEAVLAGGVMNVWYRYVAQRDGKLVLSSNIPGDVNTSVYYCVGEEAYMASINGSNEDGDIVYATAFSVKAGDVVYVHVVSNVDRGGCTVSFNLQDFKPGESLATPLELVPGAAGVEVPVATRTQWQWIHIPTQGASRITITTSRFVAGGIYYDTNVNRDYDLTFTPDADNEVHTAVYESASPVSDLYVCLTQSLGKIIMKAEITGPIVTPVQAVETVEGKADVYNLGGLKQSALKRGVNLVRKPDGRVVKVITLND